jgi:hypothetical protein
VVEAPSRLASLFSRSVSVVVMWAKRYSMKNRKTVHDADDDWVRHVSTSQKCVHWPYVKWWRRRTGGAAQVGVTLSLVEAEVGVLVEGVAGGALGVVKQVRFR